MLQHSTLQGLGGTEAVVLQPALEGVVVIASVAPEPAQGFCVPAAPAYFHFHGHAGRRAILCDRRLRSQNIQLS
jgi:hypothetical protein